MNAVELGRRGGLARPSQVRELVYAAVVALSQKRGLPPTIAELRAECGGRTKSTIHSHLVRLAAEGRLEHHVGEARAYRLPQGER